MKMNKSVLSAGLVFSVAVPGLFAVSAAGEPETAAVVSKTVFERPLKHDGDIAAHFDVDRDLGRAWIDVVITDRETEPAAQAPEVVRRALDGLYYDPARKQVIYRNGAEGIVCAEDSNFLWVKSLKDTGQCELRPSSETRRIDDGFRIEEKNVGKVVFEARSPA
jgi:hypothetical protein